MHSAYCDRICDRASFLSVLGQRTAGFRFLAAAFVVYDNHRCRAWTKVLWYQNAVVLRSCRVASSRVEGESTLG